MTLADYLDQKKITKIAFARSIRRAPSTVTRLLKGSIPDRETMKRIDRVTKGAVTPNDFFAAEQSAA